MQPYGLSSPPDEESSGSQQDGPRTAATAAKMTTYEDRARLGGCRGSVPSSRSKDPQQEARQWGGGCPGQTCASGIPGMVARSVSSGGLVVRPSWPTAQRAERKLSRKSLTKRSGCSSAGKWPPRDMGV